MQNNTGQNNSSESSSRWLWAVALTSLALNLITIGVLVAARGLVGGALAQANQSLFNTLMVLEGYEYPLTVNMQEQVRLAQTSQLLLDQSITVPISLSVPINQVLPVRQQLTVPINQTVPVRQTVNAPLTIQGTTVFIPVPIDLNVPINVEVPVDVDVSLPVAMQVSIQQELEVPVRELIPLQDGEFQPLSVDMETRTTVPVAMEDLLRETHILPTLEELHRVLNIVESLLLLPLPKADTPPLAAAP